MKKPILFLLLMIVILSGAYGKNPPSIFSRTYLKEDMFGDKLILKFKPTIPKLKALYFRKKNMSVIRWKARAKRSIIRKYIFTNPNSLTSKIVVSIDAKEKKGSIFIWQKEKDGVIVTREGGTNLVLTVKKKEEPKTEEDPRQYAHLTRDVAGTVVPKAVPVKIDRKLSLNVKDAPIDKVLRSLAAESGRSIVFGEEIGGKITVSIRDLSYEDAVETVLKPTAFAAEHNKHVTIVRAASKGKSMGVFRWQNVDVSSVEKQVKEMTKGAQVSIDPHTNTMFVMATADVLKTVERLTKVLDVSPKQVEVEAALVEIKRDDARKRGVDLTGPINSGDASARVSTTTSPFDPAATTVDGFFAQLSWRSVSAILGMLTTTTDATVLARPRIVALNDEEASIIIGSKLGYKTVTVTSTGTVENIQFLTVGTQLKLKPHITESGDILMAIKPEVSDGSLDATTELPSETTTSAETKVLCKNGQTIVIGGLLRDRTEETVTKIPILGDIPLLGFFFRGTTESVLKTEIMILLNPKIVDRKMMVGYDREGSRMIDRLYRDRLKTVPPPSRYSHNE